jgi:CheY-like chemotaxis protein
MSKPLALIIEDNEELGYIYAAALQTIDFEIENIMDGRAALERLEQVVPGLIVLDMNLPFVSGHYIYKKVRGEPRFDRTPIIIATANALIAEALASELGPADRLMVKPVSPSQLRNMARSLSELMS